jgi:hypothetical protein
MDMSGQLHAPAALPFTACLLVLTLYLALVVEIACNGKENGKVAHVLR